MGLIRIGALVLALASSALSNTYNLADNYVGSGFYSSFSFQAIADPTHGRVNYVSQSTAQSLNLSYANGNTFIMRADDTTTLSASGPGRNSVRIQSNKQYTTHTIIFDIRHMPEGCGTWPAAWEVGPNWPNEGEVDIIEGVNNVSPNQATLHTSSGCTMPSSRAMSGGSTSNDCDAPNNAGCGVQADAPNSFGPGFNNVGGGVYAMERTTSYIKVWFWARNDGSIPSEVKSGSNSINTSNWPTPFALFPDTDCDLSSKFGPNNVIFDLTFCGDWAGNSYSSSGCPSDCTTYVDSNPSAFTNAYWDIASVRVFE